jgi:hypothetical protein
MATITGEFTDNVPAAGYQVTVLATTANLADATTFFFGQLPKPPVTTADISKVFVRQNCVIKKANINSHSVVAGTSEAWDMFIRVNNTTDTLIATVAAATNERIWVNTSLNVVLAAGDYFEIKTVSPTWVTNPTGTVIGGYVYIE